MEKILKFLKENPVFYFATVEGDKPRVRPLGFVMEDEGKLYFGVGNHKQVYKQLLGNPNVELCTASPTGQWIRIKGTALFDQRPEMVEKAFQVMPQLKDIYNEKTGFHLAMLYLENVDAELADMKGGFEKI